MCKLTFGGTRISYPHSSYVCLFPRTSQGFAEVLRMKDQEPGYNASQMDMEYNVWATTYTTADGMAGSSTI